MLSASSYLALYISLILFYTHIVSTSHTWREWFYPEQASIEGNWLQVKDTASISSPIWKSEEEKTPCSIITISYDSKAKGNYYIEGVTVSHDKEIRFHASHAWLDSEKHELNFAFLASAKSVKTEGITNIDFIFEKNYKFKEAQGYFIDDRGYRVETNMYRIDDSKNLDSQIKRIRYLRDLLTDNNSRCFTPKHK